MDFNKVHNKLIDLRKLIIEMAHLSKEGHMPSSFSCLDVMYMLYKHLMKDEDTFILSKGHASFGLYAVLHSMGYISKEELMKCCEYNSNLGGHPDRTKLSEIIASTGSLGHGLPIAVGMALAKKIKKEKGKIFCVVGDGEMNEGSMWESLLIINDLKLNNIIPIIDYNKSQIRSLHIKNIDDKIKAFGLKSINIDNNPLDIYNTINDNNFNTPTAIILNSIKGQGLKVLEDNMFEWHHKPPNKEQFQEFIKTLNNAYITT